MLDQLNFVSVMSFFNDIISDDKISIYSKVFIVNDLSLCCCSNSFTCMCLIFGDLKSCYVCLKRTFSVTSRISVTYFILQN